MNEPLPDKTVILIILCTILLVFSFIFTFRQPQNRLEPSIQWRDSTPESINSLST